MTHTTTNRTDANASSVRKTFWKYAIPSIAAMVVSGLYQVIDGIFVGHFIGASGLAGINLAWPIINMVVGFGMLIGMGGGSLLSISRGEANQTKSKQVLVNALVLLLLLSGLITTVIALFGTDLLLLQSATDNSLAMAQDYMQIFCYGALFTAGATALPLMIRNDGNPNFSTWLLVAGAGLNIVLDYLLIGQFAMGLTGAAIATLIAQLTICVIGIGYFFSGYANTRLTISSKLISKQQIQAILNVGLSSFFMFIYFSFILSVHNRLLLEYGNEVHVAAFAVIGYVGTLFYLLAEGISGGMQPPVSYYFGAKQYKNVRATLLLALKIAASIAIITVATINLVPELVVSMFVSNDATLVAETINGMRLHLLALLLDGVMFIATMYYVAINKGGLATKISVANMAIQIPFLLILPTIWGINGIWLAVPISNLALCTLLLPTFIKELRTLNAKADKERYASTTNNINELASA
ncbi:MATE family efflux transporter [Shewanella maritima]|uniref:Multidrug export protein MepA n=1 Tax=Shewanella maritima TaxID=2520507 RepID=A0A411PCR1_9GAMM|nr:MATE family efflux transporter [Shewanella maritima]QBF81343.1 MATE family efflux transporter [Shewanella maritima]